MTTYDKTLSTWMATPITIGTNANGKPHGDDTGYRDMRTLLVNPAPLIAVDILTRAAYEGISPYTGQHIGGEFGGGLEKGTFVLREAAARSVKLADETLRRLSGNRLCFVGLDAFRSGLRQQLGYSFHLRSQMAAIGLTEDDVNADRRIEEFIGCSFRADGVFSWVKLIDDADYALLLAELQATPAIMDAARAYATAHMEGGATEDNVADALWEYVEACRNAGIGRAATRGNLVFENNAHAGGGAIDLMIADNGVLKVITPLDFQGYFSAYDFMELAANFDVYRAELATNAVLQQHLTQCGYSPRNLTWAQWVEMRDLKRLQFHLGRACGWTFYSMGKRGGEHWHEEPGNQVIDPLTGNVIWSEPETGATHPNRGNPGHSLQLFGPKDIGVWGGASAHALAVEHFGLVM